MYSNSSLTKTNLTKTIQRTHVGNEKKIRLTNKTNKEENIEMQIKKIICLRGK